jgi:phosphate transport system permease protein
MMDSATSSNALQNAALITNPLFAPSETNLHNKRIQTLFRLLFLLMTLLLGAPVLIILTTLVIKGGPVISIDFLFTEPTNGMTAGGIFPAMLGTVWLVTVALLISVPLGVAAAIYLSEFAPDNWLTRLINLAIINLAGVPSIVHALHGVGAFVIFAGMGTSILAASLTLAIMTMPVVIVASKEALQAVPQSFREACWAMGATRWQTIRKVVLPNAISGILTGIILEVSRTAGETAPIMFTGAVFFSPFLPQGLFDQTMALSLHLFVVSTQVPGVPENLPFGVALVLITLVLFMNSASIAFRMYLRTKKKW